MLLAGCGGAPNSTGSTSGGTTNSGNTGNGTTTDNGNGTNTPPTTPQPTTPAPGSPPPDMAGPPGDAGPSSPTNPPTATAPSHHRCGWLGSGTEADGAASFAANASFYDAVHPTWFTSNADGTIKPNSTADDPKVLATAHSHSVALMPLVYGGDDASAVRAITATPDGITRHVQNLVNLATTHGYEGLEIDYEHLWSGSDRAGYVALLKQLATALHAAGKQVSVAVPPIAVDAGGTAYDYAAIVAGGVDVVHLMGYDFHFLGGDHLGPLAPLGWIDAVNARVQKLGIADHFILGVANYGVGSGWYATSADALSKCISGTFSRDTQHMLTCPYGNYAAGLAPHCSTAQGDIWFEDSASVKEKAANAASHGLRGITYFAMGTEPAGYLDALRSVFP